MNPDWLIPRWNAPAGVRAVCTTRVGGVSAAAAFSSMNLGEHVGDDAASVAANRAALGRTLGVRPVFLQQVHGAQVAVLNAGATDGVSADGCVSAERGLACTIMVADCLPVLMTTRSGQVVAAAHAGWRGLAAGVLEATLAQLWRQTRVKSGGAGPTPQDTLVWLGPCIGPRAFEVGPEVREAFVARQPQAAEFFAPLAAGKWLANLPALARLRLQSTGIEQIEGNDGSAPWCTVGQTERFFSHRRDRVSGRMAACIWLE